MIRKVFNPTLPVLGETLRPPEFEELNGTTSFKYADFDHARRECGSEYVRNVLDRMPIQGNHKRALVDIKVHDL